MVPTDKATKTFCVTDGLSIDFQNEILRLA